MAEAVGLVASVIGIAGLAGKVVTTSYKVKALLDEVNDVPMELKRQLNQIQLLAPLLSDINDDGPPALRGALAAAVDQCQQAADELGRLAEDLYNQVHTGGSVRRKARAARVVLQKDTWTTHEQRLSSAMQMLMMASQVYGLAQQRYIIDLQRAQPNVIVTRILDSLPVYEARPPSNEPLPEPHNQGKDLVISRQRSRRGQKASWTRMFLPDLRLGFPSLTGSLEIQYGDKDANNGEESVPVFRIRTQMPRWLSTRTLDSILQRSQAGWNYQLHASNFHPESSEMWSLTKSAMSHERDSLQKLQRLLTTGRLSVYDTFELSRTISESLMDLAVEANNWKVCNFLAEYNLTISPHAFPSEPWNGQDTHFREIQKLWGQFQCDSSIPSSIWNQFTGTAAEFHALRSSAWPDWEFYDNAATEGRLLIALSFLNTFRRTSHRDFAREGARLFRYTLSRDSKLDLNGIGERMVAQTGETCGMVTVVLSCLWGVAFRCKGRSHPDANAWLDLSKDLTAYVIRETISSTSDPILVYEVVSKISIQALDEDRAKQLILFDAFRSVNTALRCMEWIRHEQLVIMSDLGIDLNAYGKWLTAKLVGTEHSWDLWGEGDFFPNEPSVTLRIVGRSYGICPEDWKVWFDEQTDEFAGEFWQLVDPAPLWIPGAWVDEE